LVAPVTLGAVRDAGHGPGWQTDSAPEPPADQPDELLAAGRPLPAWARVAAAIAVVVLAGYLVVHLVSRNGGAGAPVAAARGSSSSALGPPLFRGAPGSRTADVIPICGNGLGPLVAPAKGRPHTNLRLLIGGEGLQRVDFDTGSTATIRLPRLGQDEWVDAVSLVGGRTYAAIAGASCGLERRRILAIHGDRGTVVPGGTPSDFVTDESRAWTVVDPGHRLRFLPGGRELALPAGFAPAAATHGVIVGNLSQGMDPAEIGAVRVSNGALLSTSGLGLIIGAAAGRYVWSAGCGPATRNRCALQSATVVGRHLRTYFLPRPPGSAAGCLSPDGHTLAFTLTRATIDPYHRQGNPYPAGDVALLDLRSGDLTLVPHLELPARYQPHLAFSPSGRWLVITASDYGKTRVFAWRPGLPRPLVSPLAGVSSPAPPPVQVLNG
jgi:hypothetical protein